ncbi:MAG: magnesium-translocating P-type ATPase [Candidatus Methanomethylicota archaeon]|jgi:Mg2+-importing ATPase|uniref:Magnesium-transporting ATPase, P-type 1 n=1 Tax=Thermoproteota archaeon TaxID=2056631 RepID=A0A523BC84_9CREN|nr:MAG: magnesium-translocating P-type ATPase [Candidatus Verstraetearchaeota archaeon]
MVGLLVVKSLENPSTNNNWILPTNEEILTLPIEELLKRLKTSLNGLSSEDVEERLKLFGYNELVKKKKRLAIISFLSHFKSPLVIILLIAGLISGILGETTNAAIIFFIVVFSIILDFYQESKAERAAEMLKQRVATTATVLRDGVKREVRLSEIVPGDIIYLSAGDIVPADARVITAKDLFVNQSVLTGESFPVEKIAQPLKSFDPSITEWRNYLFMGTSVVSGTAMAVVVKTGSLTEYGKIAKRLVEREVETEFQRSIRNFGYMIMQVTFILVLFVFFINALFMRGILDSLIFSVALAVGLTPELLPMIISINLSKGAISMANKGVIVKRLAAIQNFGNMDVLCCDKTGTLTENRIKLILHVDINGDENEKVLLYSYLNSYFQTGLKSPLDEAILNFKDINVKNYQKIDEIPFDFVRKRLSVVVENQNQYFIITKGAPEEVVNICTYYEVGDIIADITDEIRRKIEQKYIELSSEGYRVLAVAYKRLKEIKPIYTVNDEKEMIFLGFIAFIDPPKETAREALQLLKKANIELKILTGDNELVTRKVCEHLGFDIKGIVTGSQIAQMHDDALARIVEEANVFCRVTPSQKDRIINALKKNGHVVGFLGDGINDAPSLKNADVGISVNNAVDIAKESADIILLQNDLKVLHDGVLEGRKTFGNTMKYIMMGVSSNFGNMFSVAGASLFLPFLPMLPTQILLNNLLYDFSQSTIPTDEVDQEYIEKPKRLDIRFIRRFMIFLGPVSSLFDFLTFFIMLFIFNAYESLFQTAWFIESLTSQTLVIFVIRTRKSPFWKSKPSKLLLLSSIAIVIFALVLPYTPLGEIFEFVRPPATFYIALAIILITYIILAEIIKNWFYKKYGNLIEQTLIPPKKIGIFKSHKPLSKNNK